MAGNRSKRRCELNRDVTRDHHYSPHERTSEARVARDKLDRSDRASASSSAVCRSLVSSESSRWRCAVSFHVLLLVSAVGRRCFFRPLLGCPRFGVVMKPIGDHQQNFRCKATCRYQPTTTTVSRRSSCSLALQIALSPAKLFRSNGNHVCSVRCHHCSLSRFNLHIV